MIDALTRGEMPVFPDGSPLPKQFLWSPLSGQWIESRWTLRERLAARIRTLRGFDRTIRMAPDYGVDVPLWPQADEINELASEVLLRRLSDWQAFCESHHHVDNGWDSEDSQARWQDKGAASAAEVKLELPRPWS